MATLAVGANVAVSVSPGQSINFASTFGTNFRYTFAPYNPEIAPTQNSSRSYGPAAQNVTIGPFAVSGAVTIYNDAGSTLTYTSQYNYGIEVGPFTAWGGVSMVPANANVTISPTGTGTVTINPTTIGSMDNVRIGQTTRTVGAFAYIGVNHGDLSGSPGAATMTTPKGRNAIAAGASSCVITDAVCAANSSVFAVISQASADATLTQIVRVVPAAGSFTVYGNANATANVTFDWFILQA